MDTYREQIERLAQDLSPVRAIEPLRTRSARWLLLTLAAVAAVAIVTPRPDLLARLAEARFELDLLVAGLTATILGVAALRGATPEGEPGLGAALSAGFLLACLVLAAWLAPHGTERSILAGWACAPATLAIAVVPAAALLVSLRRGFALAPGWSGALAGVAAASAGVLAMRLHCPIDDALHQILWHVAVVVPAAVLCALAARRWARPHVSSRRT